MGNKEPIVAAMEELANLATDTAKLHGVDALETLVFVTVYELMQKGHNKDTIARVTAEAFTNIQKAQK